MVQNTGHFTANSYVFFDKIKALPYVQQPILFVLTKVVFDQGYLCTK
jgi:hypothetical protein